MSSVRNNLENILIRNATGADVDEIRHLVVNHGNTPWNYFPKDALEKHLSSVVSGTEHAVIALDGSMLVGMVSFAFGDYYLEYERAHTLQKPTGYIVEILIHSDYMGRGIGRRLLERAKSILIENKVEHIYARRHEENKASEALMRKTGFRLVDVFPDPSRTTGSCKTAIERFSVKS